MKSTKPTFLKLIIFYKVFMGIGELIVFVLFLRLPEKNLEVLLTKLTVKLNLNRGNIIINFIITKAGMIGDEVVMGVVIVLLVFGILNLIESYGLYNTRRWGEWLTVIGTSALIPFEFYEMVSRFSLIKVWVLIANCVIVYYLAKHRELFKDSKIFAGWGPH